ncbi:MAG: exodeoxyribonuclease VII large subunit [Nibricoccus sp.]
MDVQQDGGLEQERALSVSEFTRCVKEVLEGALPPCWVRGEVSNLRQQASGHVYFSIKDSGAQLSAVMFRGDAMRQGIILRDDLQVLVYGNVSVYEARGQYQLVVRAVVEDGHGRLQREFEALKRRLADEGLFASERKVPVPTMPAVVGFITSPTGAAVQDFIRILARRGWRGRLVVLPAKVQGAGAAEEMIAQLRLAEALGIFDLLVIGRGGGSLEDLWAFNEEPLVRAIADCTIPIVSAVGHEIDFSLCDFAADVRAETPSAAAELISSSFVACAERLARLACSVEDAMDRTLSEARARVEHGASRLRLLSPASVVEHGHLRVDDLTNRMISAVERVVQLRRHGLGQAAMRFARCGPQARVEGESQRLLALWKRLESASPASVLKRGFVIMRDEAGRPLARRSEVKPGQRLQAQFGDGVAPLRAEGVNGE